VRAIANKADGGKRAAISRHADDAKAESRNSASIRVVGDFGYRGSSSVDRSARSADLAEIWKAPRHLESARPQGDAADRMKEFPRSAPPKISKIGPKTVKAAGSSALVRLMTVVPMVVQLTSHK